MGTVRFIPRLARTFPNGGVVTPGLQCFSVDRSYPA
jgi:hypothetical protein